jgi:uncharacterized protein YecE (DUF72 family)
VKVRVGTSGYAYKEWKGSFYPKGLAASAMLPYYAARFDAVEINASFYTPPDVKTVAAWAAQAPAGFSFALKAPQKITHFSRLKGVGAPVRAFLRAASALGSKGGPLLFQLPPNMKKDLRRLQNLLRLLPAKQKVAMEFRHASWFDDEVYAALRAANVALCIAHDEKGQTPLVSTASFGYVRLRDVHYTGPELVAWAATIRRQPWRQAWVFFKHEDTGRGPKLAARMHAWLYEDDAGRG